MPRGSCWPPPPPADWRRQLGRPRITWLSTIQQDLKHHHLTFPKAADLAQNRPLWRMMSTYGTTQPWVACQKRRRRIMGSAKSPCTTFYRSSIETIAVNCLVLTKIAFFAFWHQDPRWRISAILDFRGPIMGSLKSSCTTSYRSSIDTIALNCLLFEKIAFFLHFGDR